jgi:D-alanyl-D-alanine carboxypeptidase (penicillin-binding protein 5/6)
MKTGTHAAAGGCFMFRSERRTDDGNVTLIGVVLGQRGPDLRSAALEAAQQLADRVAPNAGTSPALDASPLRRRMPGAP